MGSRRAQFIIALAWMTVTTACSSSPMAPRSDTASSPTKGLAPVPSAPAFNAAVGLRPRLVVTNVSPLVVSVTSIGFAFAQGSTSYRFEISPTSSFDSLLLSGMVNEEVGQTTFVPSSDLPPGTLYWRVRAENAIGPTTSPFTNAQTVRVVPASTYIDPPTVVGPSNGSDVEIRASMVVEDARSPNPLAAFIYRSDVSLDPSFSRVLVSTTVAEASRIGGRPTTAALSPELSFDTTYFWRAQAIDTQSGAASAFTPAFTFSTHGPLPGLALLHVSIPGCNLGTGVTFDGTLTTDGTVARFVDSSHRFGPPDLTFELLRTAEGWSGRALGNGRTRDGDEVHILPPTGQAAAPVRATEVAGQLSGTFDGSVRIWNSFGDGGGLCSDEFKFVILQPK